MKYETKYGPIEITPLDAHRMVANTLDEPLKVNGMDVKVERLYLTDQPTNPHQQKDGKQWVIDHMPYSSGVYRWGTTMTDTTSNAKLKVWRAVEDAAEGVSQDALSDAEEDARQAMATRLEEKAERLREHATALDLLAWAVLYEVASMDEVRDAADRELVDGFVSDHGLERVRAKVKGWEQR